MIALATRAILGYDAASTEASIPPSAMTGSLLEVEGRRLRNRTAHVGRNEAFYANAVRKLQYAARGRFALSFKLNGERPPIAVQATDAFAEWAKDCGFQHQSGTLAQVFIRAMGALMPSGGSYIQRIIDREAARDISDPSRNGLFLQVWGERHIDRGRGQDGFEFTTSGRRSGVWFRGRSPNRWDMSFAPTLVPMSDLIVMRFSDGSSTTSGVPWGTSAIKPAVEVQQADEARLAGEQTRATMSAVALAEPTSPALHGQLVDAGITLKDTEGYQVQEIENGQILVTRGVKDFKFNNPPASQNTPATRVARVAAGLGVPVQAMTEDLADTSFSAARVGHINLAETADDIRERAAITEAKNGIVRWFIARERELGRNFDGLQFTWLRRQRPALDQQADAGAQKTRLEIGVTSRREEIETDGRDADDVEAQRQLEEPIVEDPVSQSAT